MFKPEVRIIAWDDCSFKYRTKKVRLVGVVYRGGSFPDGLLSSSIKKDGLDATEKISAAINSSRHYDQLSLIMTDGITFAGFNVVDIKQLAKQTKMPVIAVIRKKPDMQQFLQALGKFGSLKKRKNAVRNAGKIYKYKSRFGDIFYQKRGLGSRDAKEILKITCIRSNIPEPIRVAHLIATGLSGESRGRA
ncbi:MAG: DUF99 family protein [Candidatus Aenigmarchaeota archaeon]|nr:DUF99 family protein [Candidatus Aenigmarchaeota archaeon]